MQRILNFEEQQLKPDPCNKQEDHHLRKRVTKPSGEAKAGTIWVDTEKKNIMIYFFMSSLLYLNRRDFIKIPKYIYVLFCCRFRPKLLIAIFLFDVSPPNEFLLLLGQTSPVKYYNNEKIKHKAYFLTSGKVSSITFPPHKDLYLHKLAFIFDP